MTEKIQKLLSHLGCGSRRSIEKMIKSGNILINGKKAFIGQRINRDKPGEIYVQNKLIEIKKEKFISKVLVYNKPEGQICTTRDDKNRPTVFDNLPSLKNSRWVGIGRLDLNTRGLLLFTNNGNLANQLMKPKNKIEREYYIRVFGLINQKNIKILKNTIKIKNDTFVFKKIKVLSDYQNRKNTWFQAVLCEGKNHEIRKIFQFIKCQVNKLIRIRYGNVILPKFLKTGSWCELNSVSVDNLCKLISKK